MREMLMTTLVQSSAGASVKLKVTAPVLVGVGDVVDELSLPLSLQLIRRALLSNSIKNKDPGLIKNLFFMIHSPFFPPRRTFCHAYF
jgi:hypothetical protein